jgi:hypothetical protein
LRRTLIPERVDNSIDGDDLVPVKQEQGEYGPMPSGPEPLFGAVNANLERAQDAVVHAGFHASAYEIAEQRAFTAG